MYGGAHDFFSAIFKHSSSSIFNVEFNYVEHLNKQYLTPNYSAPWKPSANKLAMLMWERDFWLRACTKAEAEDTPTLRATNSGLLLTDELNRVDLIWEQ